MSNTDQMMKIASKTNYHEADENCQDTIQTKLYMLRNVLRDMKNHFEQKCKAKNWTRI